MQVVPRQYVHVVDLVDCQFGGRQHTVPTLPGAGKREETDDVQVPHAIIHIVRVGFVRNVHVL